MHTMRMKLIVMKIWSYDAYQIYEKEIDLLNNIYANMLTEHNCVSLERETISKVYTDT